MNYWLMKSEPDVFSIDDLKEQKVAGWDGVRNYQARNYLRAMRRGDLALFYHSSAEPSAIVGLMKIVRDAYPDASSREPGWDQVDVKFVKSFARPLTLQEIHRIPTLRDMVLLRHSRLSVQPILPAQWRVLIEILDK